MNHHNTRIVNLVFAFLLSLFLASCHKDQPTEPGQTHTSLPPASPYSHVDSVEASRMALWMSGDLLAPLALRDTLLFKLYNLRKTFEDSVSIDSSVTYTLFTPFRTPWRVGELVVGFDDSTVLKVVNGTYTGWMLLDSSLRPDAIPWPPDTNINTGVLTFTEEYNPVYLSGVYSRLPGVISAYPNVIYYAMFPAMLYPGLVNGELSCLYFLAPIGEKNLYFKYVQGKPEFFGYWSLNMSPKPSWYYEAKKNYDSFWSPNANSE